MATEPDVEINVGPGLSEGYLTYLLMDADMCPNGSPGQLLLHHVYVALHAVLHS
jgi:hypothetical protein